MKAFFNTLLGATFVAALVLSAPVLACGDGGGNGCGCKGSRSDASTKISIDPIWVLFGAYLPTIEMKVNKKLSLRGTLGFVNTEWTINEYMHQRPFWFIQAGVSLRYYAIGKALNGLFLENTLDLDFSFNRSGADDTLPDATIRKQFHVFAGHQVNLGYAYIFDCGWSIEGSFGFKTATWWGWNRAHDETPANPRIGMRVGYAF